MNRETVIQLNELNARFYRENAASFSATRASGWGGWERLPELIGATGAAASAGADASTCGAAADAGADGAAAGTPLRVLDVAGGNLRFERFLAERLPAMNALGFRALVVDNCDELAACGEISTEYRHLDVMQLLLENEASGALAAWLGGFPSDLVVSFGFLHHVPSAALRKRVLDELLACVKPGGLVVVSLWRFLDDEAQARKADKTHAAALAAGVVDAVELEDGDRFLGWQGLEGTWRYCHHFSDAEIDALCAHVAPRAELVARYRADGQSGRMNSYLVLRRR